jgi:hypothetical protein
MVTIESLEPLDTWILVIPGYIDMSKTERRLKKAVWVLVMHDIYPSPTSINKLLGRDPLSRQMNNLNDRECNWRREICKSLGFTLRGKNL